MRRIINLVLSLVLSAVLIAEIVCTVLVFFYIPKRYKELSALLANTAPITDIGQNGVTIDALPADLIPTGDVIEIFGVNFQCAGTYENVNKETTSVRFDYSISENDVNIHTAEATFVSGVDSTTAFENYMSGDTEMMVGMFDTPLQTENVHPYYYDYDGGKCPIFQDTASQYWFGAYPTDDGMLLTKSAEPMVLTHKMATIHYAKASESVLEAHTFSDYETAAIANTRRKALEASDNKDAVVDISDVNRELAEVSADSLATNDYSGSSYDTARKAIVRLKNIKFGLDGTSDDTSTTIEYNTKGAEAYEYDIAKDADYQNDPPTWDINGLQFSGVDMKYTSQKCDFAINVKNTSQTARPIAVIFKFIDADGNLIGTAVYDGMTERLAPGDSTKVSVTTDLNQEGGELAKVQFMGY